MAGSRLVHMDCAHYRGHMPCEPHKLRGRVCADCPEYDPRHQRVLIVKLGAMGDVLRTAALLPDICARHDRPYVVWLTRPESAELIAGNPLVQQVMVTTEAASLLRRHFDAVYALDSDPDSLGFADSAQTELRRGFVTGKFGTCAGVAPGGDPTLFELGLWDDLKRQNRRTYLDLLAAAAGITYSGERPWISRDPDAFAAAQASLTDLPRPLVGINVDAGGRWERKRWNDEYVDDLIERLVEDNCGAVLFGTGWAYERNLVRAAKFPGRALAFASGGRPLRFIAGIAQCGVLLTGDTLGMHVAWALHVPAVALFGPTSLSEIDLGNDSRKLAASGLECLGCYLKTCSVEPHCMDRLTPEIVYAHLREVLSAV